MRVRIPRERARSGRARENDARPRQLSFETRVGESDADASGTPASGLQCKRLHSDYIVELR